MFNSFQCMIIVLMLIADARWCMIYAWIIMIDSLHVTHVLQVQILELKIHKTHENSCFEMFLRRFRWFSTVWNLKKSTLVFQVQFFWVKDFLEFGFWNFEKFLTLEIEMKHRWAREQQPWKCGENDKNKVIMWLD